MCPLHRGIEITPLNPRTGRVMTTTDLRSESAPIVFVSYSHDSDEHKSWVRAIADRLIAEEIDVRLDVYELDFGDDVARFMHSTIAKSLRVLVVCTPAYKAKAEAGKGGVGYEATIVTGELASEQGGNKFVPLIREGADIDSVVPSYLRTRLAVRLLGAGEPSHEWDRLVTSIKSQRPSKPLPTSSRVSNDHQDVLPKIEIGHQTSNRILPVKADLGVQEIVVEAFERISRNDLRGFRQLAKGALDQSRALVTDWLSKRSNVPSLRVDLPEWAWSLADCYESYFAMALAAASSESDRYVDQVNALYEILSPPGWPAGGPTILVYAPKSIGCLYHAIYGAIRVVSATRENLFAIAEIDPNLGLRTGSLPLWQESEITCWTPMLDGDVIASFKWVLSAWTHWPWLSELFDSEEHFKSQVLAHFAVLHLASYRSYRHEAVSAGKSTPISISGENVKVPLIDHLFTENEAARALRILVGHKDSIRRYVQVASDPFDRKIFEAWLLAHQSGLQLGFFGRNGQFMKQLGQSVLETYSA